MRSASHVKSHKYALPSKYTALYPCPIGSDVPFSYFLVPERINTPCSSISFDEDEMRKGYREFARQLRLAQEEMGLSRYEAIIFLSTLIGNSMHK